jgi:sigma-B regulation protein RsbQ
MIRLIVFVYLLALICGCEGTTSRPEELKAYDSTQFERVSINYEIYGKQDTTLIFIHGWNLNLRYWDDQVKFFKDRYRILNLDLAGHGNSGRDRSNWTVESFARDITTIMEKESISKAILVGHSMGGQIALHVFEAAPEKIIRIVGIDCFKNPEFEITHEFKNDFRVHLSAFKKNYAEMAGEEARKNVRTKNREVINRIVRDYKAADPKTALSIYRNVIPKYAIEKEKLQKLPFPLYIIGNDYIPFDENGLRRYARNGYELIIIPDSGHFPMVEQPQHFNASLDSVLQKI